MKPEPGSVPPSAEYLHEESARMESWKAHTDGSINYGDHRNIWESGRDYGKAALQKANAEVERLECRLIDYTENVKVLESEVERLKGIIVSLSEQRERLERMEWALTRIADVTSALHCGGRKTSFADFELRQIARSALAPATTQAGEESS